MFVSKKEFLELKKKVADLEAQVQSQQKVMDYLNIDISISPYEFIQNVVNKNSKENGSKNGYPTFS